MLGQLRIIDQPLPKGVIQMPNSALIDEKGKSTLAPPKVTLSLNGGKEHDLNTKSGKKGATKAIAKTITKITKEEMQNAPHTAKIPAILAGEAQDVGGVVGKRLLAFFERVERLEEEKAALSQDIKEVFAEAKSAGFEVKIMRKIYRLRQMPVETRQEEDELLRLYMAAIGMA